MTGRQYDRGDAEDEGAADQARICGSLAIPGGTIASVRAS